jgi:hypothetical protein
LWNRCVANVKSTLSQIAAAPFRAALAMAVLFMLLMQPSAYAYTGAAVSLGGKAVPSASVAMSQSSDAAGPVAIRHTHSAEHGDHDSSAAANDGYQVLVETCCDLQCSPAAWIPSSQEGVTGQLARSFELTAVERLPLGGYEAAIRPPRR